MAHEREPVGGIVGDYSAFVETRTAPSGETKGTPHHPRLSQCAADEQVGADRDARRRALGLPHNGGHMRHPLRLKETVAHTDPRFRKLTASVAPVGPTR